MSTIYKVLIADLIGLKLDAQGQPDHSDVAHYIQELGHTLHQGIADDAVDYEPGIHFFYAPDLSREEELLPITKDGQYDAVIAAATFIPEGAVFNEGGVRIGAGTGNMGSKSWGGGNGTGGQAPLMNTPSFNSRATAQMAMKALLKALPDLNVDELHTRVCAGDFDTGKNLCEYPTEKLEGKTLAVIGYGNIGREVANLAKAFGMQVTIHARPNHREWIESEGFQYAATPVEAATGADVLSPHTGLGAFDPQTGKFANDSVINSEVMNALNDGAVLINYDRGECVNAEALDAALTSGKIKHAAIDADLFKHETTGELSGPMVPYLPLIKKHPGRLELLPHAAADTEHVSRVEGARQAIDQIVDCIVNKRVTNLKGDLPPGYTDAGPVTVPGVGKVTSNRLNATSADKSALDRISGSAQRVAGIWQDIASAATEEERAKLISDHGSELIKCSNTYVSLMEKHGLKGPYSG